MNKHYEKLHMSKSHCPTTKAQKTIHIQLLCNHPLGITTIMEISPWKYKELINQLLHQKINFIIVANELKIGLLYNNLYMSYIHP